MLFPFELSEKFHRFTKISTVTLSTLVGLTAVLMVASCSQEPSSGILTNTTSDSIIGGQAATAGDAVTRSTVALVTAKNDILKESCTGTLISQNLVLTAAHCLEGLRPSNVWIHFGENLPRPFYLSQLMQVQDFITNDKFAPTHDNATELNDIAVILLKQNAPEGYMPVSVKAGASVNVGDKLLLAGYGYTDDKKKMRAQNLNYARVPVSKRWQSLLILDQTNQSGACNGDSGGPAYLETESGLVVTGVTRGAHNKSPHCHGFTEYSNTTYFKSFILESAQFLEAELPQFDE